MADALLFLEVFSPPYLFLEVSFPLFSFGSFG